MFIINGIPFLEGTKIIKSGSNYGFRIGMSKEESFTILKTNYSKENYFITTIWDSNSEQSRVLEKFPKVTFHMGFRDSDPYYKFRDLIKNKKKLISQLQLLDTWKIEMPENWVDTLTLFFENNKLVEMQRTKYLFERP